MEEVTSTVEGFTSATSATLPDLPSSSASSEYLSARIQSVNMERSEIGTNLEAEKKHWSELRSEEVVTFNAEKNLELFQSLQRQWPYGFFKDWKDDVFAVGKSIGEGGQGDIRELVFLKPEHAHLNNVFVLKVFPGDSAFGCLQHLQKQMPQGMLDKANAIQKPYYMSSGSSVTGSILLKDGRFAFYMNRYWGDLRKLIETKMEQTPNRAQPFVDDSTFVIIFAIARAMSKLHKDNILHRGLKAANVLVASAHEDTSSRNFDPTTDKVFEFTPVLADFECSVGVVGTAFWRAPEILLSLKNHGPQPFTAKADVYSYAMTCFEVVTGKVPFEGIRKNDYDFVLKGGRPVLPSDTKPWIKCLLSRCWEHDPANRPSFDEIMDGYNSGRFWGNLIE